MTIEIDPKTIDPERSAPIHDQVDPIPLPSEKDQAEAIEKDPIIRESRFAHMFDVGSLNRLGRHEVERERFFLELSHDMRFSTPEFQENGWTTDFTPDGSSEKVRLSIAGNEGGRVLRVSVVTPKMAGETSVLEASTPLELNVAENNFSMRSGNKMLRLNDPFTRTVLNGLKNRHLSLEGLHTSRGSKRRGQKSGVDYREGIYEMMQSLISANKDDVEAIRRVIELTSEQPFTRVDIGESVDRLQAQYRQIFHRNTYGDIRRLIGYFGFTTKESTRLRDIDDLRLIDINRDGVNLVLDGMPALDNMRILRRKEGSEPLTLEDDDNKYVVKNEMGKEIAYEIHPKGKRAFYRIKQVIPFALDDTTTLFAEDQESEYLYDRNSSDEKIEARVTVKSEADFDINFIHSGGDKRPDRFAFTYKRTANKYEGTMRLLLPGGKPLVLTLDPQTGIYMFKPRNLRFAEALDRIPKDLSGMFEANTFGIRLKAEFADIETSFDESIKRHDRIQTKSTRNVKLQTKVSPDRRSLVGFTREEDGLLVIDDDHADLVEKQREMLERIIARENASRQMRVILGKFDLPLFGNGEMPSVNPGEGQWGVEEMTGYDYPVVVYKVGPKKIILSCYDRIETASKRTKTRNQLRIDEEELYSSLRITLVDNGVNLPIDISYTEKSDRAVEVTYSFPPIPVNESLTNDVRYQYRRIVSGANIVNEGMKVTFNDGYRGDANFVGRVEESFLRGIGSISPRNLIGRVREEDRRNLQSPVYLAEAVVSSFVSTPDEFLRLFEEAQQATQEAA